MSGVYWGWQGLWVLSDQKRYRGIRALGAPRRCRGCWGCFGVSGGLRRCKDVLGLSGTLGTQGPEEV